MWGGVVYTTLAISLCVCWGGGRSCVQYAHLAHRGGPIRYKPVCVWGGGGAMYSILGISLHVHTCRR